MTLISWLRRNTLLLPYGHFLRNGLVLTYKVIDPVVADILWMVFGIAVLFFFGMAGSQEQPAWLFVSFGSALLTGVCFITAQSLRWNLEQLAKLLECGPQALSLYGYSQLVAMARRELQNLANKLVHVEQLTEPYSEERAKAKRRFEDAYWFFLEHHLIEDVGYGAFFKR